MAFVERGILSSWQCTAILTRIPVYVLRARPQCSNRKRVFHSSRQYLDEARQPTQAQPLAGYYADLLSTPTPTESPHGPATTANATRMQTKEDRARVVFGSRLAGSGYERRSSDTPDATWRTINGIPVPPRPAEPDNCCMSGCVHCVWDDYRDEVEGWAMRIREAQAKSTGGGGSSGQRVSARVGMQRTEVANASKSMDDDGGGSETNWDGSDAGELFSSIPVGIREFMRTEKRLRDKHSRGKQKR
jgi:Oxidoreductase-like protein, N-terminal